MRVEGELRREMPRRESCSRHGGQVEWVQNSQEQRPQVRLQ